MKPNPKKVADQSESGATILSINKDPGSPTTDERAKGSSVVAERTDKKIHGAIIGHLKGFNETGQPLVAFSGNPNAQAIPADTITALSGDEEERRVLLQFEHADPNRPIIMGLLQPTVTPALTGTEQKKQVDLKVDGETLRLTADKEIVIRCGKASITLTKAGKIIIRGAYLVNRSTGVNRIKGGSVQIN